MSAKSSPKTKVTTDVSGMETTAPVSNDAPVQIKNFVAGGLLKKLMSGNVFDLKLYLSGLSTPINGQVVAADLASFPARYQLIIKSADVRDSYYLVLFNASVGNAVLVISEADMMNSLNVALPPVTKIHEPGALAALAKKKLDDVDEDY